MLDSPFPEAAQKTLASGPAPHEGPARVVARTHTEGANSHYTNLPEPCPPRETPDGLRPTRCSSGLSQTQHAAEMKREHPIRVARTSPYSNKVLRAISLSRRRNANCKMRAFMNLLKTGQECPGHDHTSPH